MTPDEVVAVIGERARLAAADLAASAPPLTPRQHVDLAALLGGTPQVSDDTCAAVVDAA